jgi:hypothetical protein|tara:strand:+ start:3052 stop:3264 length:213 start_codon:yes stop_codon:yes gene_type:complete
MAINNLLDIKKNILNATAKTNRKGLLLTLKDIHNVAPVSYNECSASTLKSKVLSELFTKEDILLLMEDKS